MVDQSLKLWNTFFDVALKWQPVLVYIYDSPDKKIEDE